MVETVYSDDITFEEAVDICRNRMSLLERDASATVEPDEFPTGDPRMLLADKGVIEVDMRNKTLGDALIGIKPPHREDILVFNCISAYHDLDEVLEQLGF